MATSNDRQRLSEVIARDWARFVAFVRRAAGDLSQMDAEDIVAEVVFSLWNRADLAAPVTSLLSYLYTALTHRLIDARRGRRPAESLEAREEAGEPVADAAGDAEAAWARRELRERLYAAVAQLPPRQRAVWIATEIAGHTFEELAREWEEPLGTLLARKHRATQRLRTLLSDLRESSRDT